MIIGIGTDLIEICRIEKLLEDKKEQFLKRIFTSLEQERSLKSPYPANSLAKRFAAKEAIVKALGTGFREGISFHDIEISNHPNGQPVTTLKNKALEILTSKLPPSSTFSVHLTLSDSHHYAVAFALIEGIPF
jgi:holo-[acyl-carrier protein] synthase